MALPLFPLLVTAHLQLTDNQCLSNMPKIVLQKMAFWLVKDGILEAKRRPFTMRKAAFWDFVN